MSSIMRRRSGLMGAWLMGAPGLEVRLLNPSILKPGRFPSHHLHHDTRAPLAHACLRLARSAFVQCEGFRMTAPSRTMPRAPGAVVRKPPRKESAGSGAPGSAGTLGMWLGAAGAAGVGGR